jgi:hypothetical protein
MDLNNLLKSVADFAPKLLTLVCLAAAQNEASSALTGTVTNVTTNKPLRR